MMGCGRRVWNFEMDDWFGRVYYQLVYSHCHPLQFMYTNFILSLERLDQMCPRTIREQNYCYQLLICSSTSEEPPTGA